MANGIVIPTEGLRVGHHSVDTTTDTNGNAIILNSAWNSIVVGFTPDSQNIDANLTWFVSAATGHTYIHASSFANGSAVASGSRIKGEVYYVAKPV